MALDETGNRFGRLLVIERVGEPHWRGASWRCRCDCGTERVLPGSALRPRNRGGMKSCGCSSAPPPAPLAGRRFGMLVAVECLGKGSKQGRVWRCRCDCGGELVVRGKDLPTGNTVSCGCRRASLLADMAARLVDETGKRHGRLTVLRRAGRTTRRGVRWECRCDCGRDVVVLGGALRSGNTKSCGCGRSSHLRQPLAAP